ncbi:MAG: ATP-binding protein [Anaerolineales bacterium]|nr:ATP-binding protein [Anaerolineales bacterium]
MKIKSLSIQNFRSIQNQSFNSKELSIFIGNNGTGKTSILEAINFCLSPQFLSGRIKHTDFCANLDAPIIIDIKFDSTFTAKLPDGYTTQTVKCDGVHLEIKKREKASAGKAFSDIVVITHYVTPDRPKDEAKGWKIIRQSGKPFYFDERLLTFSQAEIDDFPRSFYFGKNRERQLQKGYNSSISSIIEDFNWRFTKTIQEELAQTSQSDFFLNKHNFEQEIINKVDRTAFDKSMKALNLKLKNFDIENINFSFVDGNAPFDSAFLSHKLQERFDLPVSNLGSGIEMIVSLLFLETLASFTKSSIVILIDEPELHLHPKLQEKFVQYLIQISSQNQIVISTHSPYFFKNCLSNTNIELLITKKTSNESQIENTGGKFNYFPWSPSWGEINYLAYDLPTVEFYNELYGYLQEETKSFTIDDLEQHFVNNGIGKTKKWIKVNKDGTIQPPKDMTLISYIRNFFHHPENKHNSEYSPLEFKESIQKLIQLVEALKTLP